MRLIEANPEAARGGGPFPICVPSNVPCGSNTPCWTIPIPTTTPRPPAARSVLRHASRLRRAVRVYRGVVETILRQAELDEDPF